MAAGWLKLKFEEKGAGLVRGAAWVVADGHEVTSDCATFSELECRLREIEQDVAAIRKAGKAAFDRCQRGH
ncbi:hypothetical protein [Brevundimonas sp. SL161]|uniref:hypothetical protein n=1 Tax=Brevundimonas sp. SL161 TaxID=2804613 RepID=UPI003CEB9A35